MPDLDTPTIRRVAVQADSDPRTVARVMRGEQVRPLSRRRIVRALAELGMLDALPPGTPIDPDLARRAM